MPTLAERIEKPVFQVLVYGKPKTGKSVFAATFPRPRIIDCDNGMLSIVWACTEGIVQTAPEDIVYETIVETERDARGYVKKATAYDRVVDTINAWCEDSEIDKWDTLILDSATAFSEFCINRALDNMDKLGYSKSHKEAQKVSMRVMAMQDWGASSSLFSQVIDFARSLDKNVVLVCHEYEQMTDGGFVTGMLPLLIGQLRQRIVMAFDEVYYFEAITKQGKTVYTMRTKPDSKVVAGSRIGSLPPVIENPTYSKLMEYVGRPAPASVGA